MIRQDHLSDANRQGGVSNSGFIGEAACYFERASGNVQRTLRVVGPQCACEADHEIHQFWRFVSACVEGLNLRFNFPNVGHPYLSALSMVRQPAEGPDRLCHNGLASRT